MAKAYTNEEIEAFKADFYKSNQTVEIWCANKNPTTPKPSLAKMQEWLGLKPVKELALSFEPNAFQLNTNIRGWL